MPGKRQAYSPANLLEFLHQVTTGDRRETPKRAAQRLSVGAIRKPGVAVDVLTIERRNRLNRAPEHLVAMGHAGYNGTCPVHHIAETAREAKAPFAQCQFNPCVGLGTGLIVRPSPNKGDRIWRSVDRMRKLSACLQRLPYPHRCFMAAVRGRPSGLPELGPGSPTCVQLSPIRLATTGDSLTY